MISALGAGFVFGIGDPSLLLVMGGAVIVTAIAFRPLLKKQKLEFVKDIDIPLLAGAALFGIGWGIGGYCPGPALTALSNLSVDVLVFVAAMVGGGFLAKIAAPAGPGA